MNDLPTLFVKERGQTVALLDFATKQRLTLVNFKGNLSETKISQARSAIDTMLQTNAYQIIMGTAPLDKSSEDLYTIDKCFMAAGIDGFPLLPILKTQSSSLPVSSPPLTSLPVSSGASIPASDFPQQGEIGRITIWNSTANVSSGLLLPNENIQYSTPLSVIRSEINAEEIEISACEWAFVKRDGSMINLADELNLKAHEILRNIDIKGKQTIAFVVQHYLLSRVSLIDEVTNKSLGYLDDVSPTISLVDLRSQMVSEEIIKSEQTVTFYDQGDKITQRQAKALNLQKIMVKENDKCIVRITIS